MGGRIFLMVLKMVRIFVNCRVVFEFGIMENEFLVVVGCVI